MTNQLNPRLFENGKMIDEVREALLRIFSQFISDLNDQELKVRVLDVVLVGSNASYNYTPCSDIDLHIIVDYREVSPCSDVVSILMDTEKSLFNKDYDIKVKDYNVELYVEDLETSSTSNGIYSVLYDKWIKFPEKLSYPELDLSSQDFVTALNCVNHALASSSVDEVSLVIDKLYLLRKYSIMSEGEFGEGNLIFKEIRNRGLLDRLKDKKLELISQNLTCERLELKVGDDDA